MTEIRCPWCGEKMTALGERHGEVWIAQARCRACGAKGPIAAAANETKARELAEKSARATEAPKTLRKPLQLYDIEKGLSVWLEIRGTDESGDYYVQIFRESDVIFESEEASGEKKRCLHTSYGRAWRAWAEAPTDEERKAAKWA